MNVIVVGCGRLGGNLAYRLSQRGYQVVVVDQNPAAFNNMPPDFHGRTVEGDMLAEDVWHRAGIEQADSLAAVTSSDTLNAVVAHVARTVYHVLNVVVRNYDSRWRPLQEAFGLQIVGPASWGAQRIEEMLHYGEMRPVFSAGNGEIGIYEVIVSDAWQSRRLEEFLTGTGCLAAAVSRAGRAMLPAPEIILEGGDVVHVSATQDGIEALQQRLPETREV
ncbi:MAG: NAD-binding protein [Anaerolineae bacterium]|nr:NAD-binding protein [Anaerolineae bacterium]